MCPSGPNKGLPPARKNGKRRVPVAGTCEVWQLSRLLPRTPHFTGLFTSSLNLWRARNYSACTTAGPRGPPSPQNKKTHVQREPDLTVHHWDFTLFEGPSKKTFLKIPFLHRFCTYRLNNVPWHAQMRYIWDVRTDTKLVCIKRVDLKMKATSCAAQRTACYDVVLISGVKWCLGVIVNLMGDGEYLFASIFSVLLFFVLFCNLLPSLLM